MIKYVFRDGPLCIKSAKKANAQKLGEAYDKAGRNSEAVHDAAENNPRHPFHQHLEWDDAKAARLYRIEQIDRIVRLIATPDVETGEARPAFISLAPNHGERARYMPQEIWSNADLQAEALRVADRDLEAFQRRHRMLSDICADIEEVREKIRQRREQTESRQAAA